MGDSSPRGVWICVDGVEGTGKTTISQHLARTLPVKLAPEFSNAPFGEALRAAVTSTPHYISLSSLGQSLVFLGDFVEVHASDVAPSLDAGVSVVSDRGYLSKYAYQEVVLSRTLGVGPALNLLDAVFELLPLPRLTIHLVAPGHLVRERLLNRDGHCDDARETFIAQAAKAAARYLERRDDMNAVTLDTDRPLSEIVNAATSIVQQLI